MDFSDEENGSDGASIDDILGPEDLFNDEADEEENDAENDHGKTGDKLEAQEDSKENIERKVRQPRIVKNPRKILNIESLRGKNGLSALKKLFSNFKFKGNNHEKEDLTKIMGILQQWMCYQLCPSYDFESCMLQLEALGKKKAVQTLMKRYRLGIDDWGENEVDGKDNFEAGKEMETNEMTNQMGEFDLLMNEEVAHAENEAELRPYEITVLQKATPEPEFILTQEQLERIARNRKLAEERKLKKMQLHCEQMDVNDQPEKNSDQDISVERISLEENN